MVLQQDPPSAPAPRDVDALLNQLQAQARGRERSAAAEAEARQARIVAMGKKGWNYGENRPMTLAEQIVGPEQIGFWEAVSHNWGQKIPFLLGSGKSILDVNELREALTAERARA